MFQVILFLYIRILQVIIKFLLALKNYTHMSRLVPLTFSVTAETSLGQQVFICGSVKQLGSWETTKALKLYTSKQYYPQWKNKGSLFASINNPIQFKIFVKNAQGLIQWEKTLQNRKVNPNCAMIINCTLSNIQMVLQPVQIKQEPNQRKNTFEIMNDFSDQVSQSSSGNQRQYWLQRSTKVRATISSSRQFVSTAKSIYEAWEFLSGMKQKQKQKSNINNWLKIVSSVHIIIKKGKNHVNRRLTYSQQARNKSANNTKVSNVVVIQAMTLHQIKSIVFGKQFYDDVLKIVHLQEQQWNQEEIKQIQKMLQAFYVIHLTQINDNKNIFDMAQIVVIRSKDVLDTFVDKLSQKKIKSFTFVKDHQFLIKKQQNQSMILYFEPNLPRFGAQFITSCQYFSSVEKNVLNYKNFTLSDNLRISIMIEKNILRQVRKNKFCIAILCQKLQEIPQKALTNLIRVSSCQNVSINIMTVDDIGQIYRKLPVSQKEKILVYNRFSDVFKPFKKPSNLFQELKLSKTKYQQIFRQLKNVSKFWFKVGQFQTNQTPFSIQFFTNNNLLGEALSQNFIRQISKINNVQKYPFHIEKCLTADRLKILIQVRPVLCTAQFYTKVITAIQLAPVDDTYFISFDFTRNKYRFIQKMQKSGLQKQGVCQGFILQKQSHQRGLTQVKFQEFLSVLLTQSQSLIEQQFQQPKAKQEKGLQKKQIGSQVIH